MQGRLTGASCITTLLPLFTMGNVSTKADAAFADNTAGTATHASLLVAQPFVQLFNLRECGVFIGKTRNACLFLCVAEVLAARKHTATAELVLRRGQEITCKLNGKPEPHQDEVASFFRDIRVQVIGFRVPSLGVTAAAEEREPVLLKDEANGGKCTVATDTHFGAGAVAAPLHVVCVAANDFNPEAHYQLLAPAPSSPAYQKESAAAFRAASPATPAKEEDAAVALAQRLDAEERERHLAHIRAYVADAALAQRMQEEQDAGRDSDRGSGSGGPCAASACVTASA